MFGYWLESPPWLLWSHTTILVITCMQSSIFLYCVLGQYLRKLRCQAKQPLCKPPPLDSYPPVSLIVPCYLPNEVTIIEATLNHVLRLDYPGKVTVWCVYNTPDPMPEAEADLRRLAKGPMPAQRTLRIVNASGQSTSKAENLNIIVSQLSDPLISIYDADHRPEQGALKLLVETQRHRDADVVQGSIAIRTRPNLLAKYVCAETFAQHFVYFPMVEQICDTGFYGGSNAVWKTDTLRRYTFRKRMLTEDIDLSSRAIFDGARLHLCPEARSSELPTHDFAALWKQRRRWAIGWDQVAIQTFYTWCGTLCTGRTRVVSSDGKAEAVRARQDSGTPTSEFTFHGKKRVLLLFPLQRWILFFLTFFVAIISPVISLFYDVVIVEHSQLAALAAFLRIYLFLSMAAIVVCAMGHAAIQEPSWEHVFWVLLFYMSAPVYALWNFGLFANSITSIVTGTVGDWCAALPPHLPSPLPSPPLDRALAARDATTPPSSPLPRTGT